MLCQAGSAASASSAERTRSIAPGPASTVSPTRTAGEEWQKPRQTVSASETSPSALRSPSSSPRPSRSSRDVLVAAGGEAGGAGADPDVAAAPRLQQVVVEGRDAVDGGLGEPGELGGALAVLVGDLARAVHRPLEDVECGGGLLGVVAADQLYEVAAQLRPSLPGIQSVPASGTLAIAAASRVSATMSSGSRLWTWDLPQARARVCASSTIARR